METFVEFLKSYSLFVFVLLTTTLWVCITKSLVSNFIRSKKKNYIVFILFLTFSIISSTIVWPIYFVNMSIKKTNSLEK